MTKRKVAFDSGQLGFSFEPGETHSAAGSLANIDRLTASAVATILKDDPRTRYEVAGGVSALLEAEVSKLMLDAYSSEARENHNIGFGRMLVLIAETQRYDVLRKLLRQIGCDLVVGEEVLTVELGHIQSQMEALQARARVLKKVAPPISRRGRSK
ncbi:MAG: hypothetical protein JWP35_3505 [Caulobacter sp.]|nr:hypothetical protein [Caulobacter sp.]